MKEFKTKNVVVRIHTGKRFNSDLIRIPSDAASRYAETIQKGENKK